MTKPLIGILGRKDRSKSRVYFDGSMIPYDYLKSLDKEDVNYIGLITNEDYKDIDEVVLVLCDGIIIPGGLEIKDYHIKVIKYALQKGIPLLGICLGCQAIGLATMKNEKLIKTSAIHNPLISKPEQRKILVHDVMLKEGSLLFQLFGPKIKVNSFHSQALPNVMPPMEVVSLSDDGFIEAIEHTDKNKFVVGVQWHPEYIDMMQPLFSEFVNKANQYKESKSQNI